MNLSLLTDLGAEGALLALLLCGHALGDFVFQTDRMVRRKREARWLIYHALEVTLLQAILLIPFFSWRTFLVVLGLGTVHWLVDRLKVELGPRLSRPLLAFWLDQLCHLLALGAAWRLLLILQQSPLPLFAPILPTLTAAAVAVAAFAFNVNGGAAVIGMLLEGFQLPGEASEGSAEDGSTEEARDRTLRMGRMIGILERMLVVTLVLIDQWGALGLILAAKSIARFKDLEKRRFGEYYLVGTLTSFLIAIASALLAKALV